MYILSRLQDQIRVAPRDFHLPRPEALSNQINSKYSNRIVNGVGLVIRVHDILDVSESHVHACQDGAYQCLVTFRVVVFRPYPGEVLTGRIASNLPEGIKSMVSPYSTYFI